MSLDLEKKFTVWVGGVEVNDYLLTLQEAEELAEDYEMDGYDDVIIEDVSDED
tara:strand:+ start:1526 stop:1684 length:159 start_codon:yes stop_codon:yes gene_type:complete